MFTNDGWRHRLTQRNGVITVYDALRTAFANRRPQHDDTRDTPFIDDVGGVDEEGTLRALRR